MCIHFCHAQRAGSVVLSCGRRHRAAAPSPSSRCTAADPQHTAAVAPDSGSGSGNGSNNVTGRRYGGGGGDNSQPGGTPRSAGALLQQLLAVLAAVLLPALLPAPAAAARSGFVSQRDERAAVSSWQLDAFVDRMWDLSGPIINNMGFSGLVGACTAAALKVCEGGRLGLAVGWLWACCSRHRAHDTPSNKLLVLHTPSSEHTKQFVPCMA